MATDVDTRDKVIEIVENCIGCKWTMRILHLIRLGRNRPGQMERETDGLTTKVLNERLTKLMRYGLIEKVSYAEVPPRVEYLLTPFGKRFVAILDQFKQLSEEYAQTQKGPGP